MWAFTKVVPSQATPSTQTEALIPDLKVGALRMSAGRTFATVTMIAAIESMIAMIAASRGIGGFAIHCSLSLMAAE